MMYFIFYKFYPTTLSTIILLSSIFTPTYVTISITISVITFTIDVILILYVMVRPSLMTVIIYVTNLHLSSLIHLPYVMTYVITIAVIVPIYFAMAVNWHHLYAIVNDVMICGHQWCCYFIVRFPICPFYLQLPHPFFSLCCSSKNAIPIQCYYHYAMTYVMTCVMIFAIPCVMTYAMHHYQHHYHCLCLYNLPSISVIMCYLA